MIRHPGAPSRRDLYIDAAGAPNAAPNSPRHRVDTIVTNVQLQIPLGTTMAGKIQLSAETNLGLVDVSAWVTGWWR